LTMTTSPTHRHHPVSWPVVSRIRSDVIGAAEAPAEREGVSRATPVSVRSGRSGESGAGPVESAAKRVAVTVSPRCVCGGERETEIERTDGTAVW
jgi:hypothetical protein